MSLNDNGATLKTVNGHKNRVLIIDDDLANVKLLSIYLEKDYDIIVAYNGKEALLKIEHEKPDIVLLDIMMPDISGYEVCERIKSNEPASFTPVIMVTALSDVEAKIRSIDIGADDYLTKPIIGEELLARIKSLLKKKHSLEQILKSKEIMEAQNEKLLKEQKKLKEIVHDRTKELIRTKIQAVKMTLKKES